MEKMKMFGKQTPWVWVIEIVHGCNLSCGHCAMAVLDRTPRCMSMETWEHTMEIIRQVNPASRVELAMGGEPTLHPDIYGMLKRGREITPLSQFQITTNGTMLTKGVVTYRGLMDAGCNIVYTDMYSPRKRFQELAKESGFVFWFYYPENEDEPVQPEGCNPWTYYGPHIKWIPLQNNPSNWPKSRLTTVKLGTWFNHIDEKKAAKFGMKKVGTPDNPAPFRRCNQPFLYVPVSWTGDYILCCMDMALETVGHGNVSGGVEGFKEWWFGKFMQNHRRWLREKDRMKSPYCSRCDITYNRCDFRHWTDFQVSSFYRDGQWVNYRDPLYRVTGPEIKPEDQAFTNETLIAR